MRNYRIHILRVRKVVQDPIYVKCQIFSDRSLTVSTHPLEVQQIGTFVQADTAPVLYTKIDRRRAEYPCARSFKFVKLQLTSC
jgi:hypothetical protein